MRNGAFFPIDSQMDRVPELLQPLLKDLAIDGVILSDQYTQTGPTRRSLPWAGGVRSGIFGF